MFSPLVNFQRLTVSLLIQDMPDQSPMSIKLLLNKDHYRSILINKDQFDSIEINAKQCRWWGHCWSEMVWSGLVLIDQGYITSQFLPLCTWLPFKSYPPVATEILLLGTICYLCHLPHEPSMFEAKVNFYSWQKCTLNRVHMPMSCVALHWSVFVSLWFDRHWSALIDLHWLKGWVTKSNVVCPYYMYYMYFELLGGQFFTLTGYLLPVYWAHRDIMMKILNSLITLLIILN